MRDLAFGERQRKLQPLDLGRIAFVRAVAFGNRPIDGTFKMLANAICRRSLVGPDRNQHLLDLGKPDVGNRQVANDRFDICFQPRPDLAGVPFGFPFLLHHRDVGLGGLIDCQRRSGDQAPLTAFNDRIEDVVAELARINALDAGGFWDLVRPQQDDLKWCGSSPFYTFLKTAPQARGELLKYEQWNIDENSVVSFAGMGFRKV